MAVKIRLTRAGTRKKPFYRIVAAEIGSPRDGRFIEILGNYDPRKDPPEVKFKEERVREWLSRGAEPTLTVSQLLKKKGITTQRAGKKTA
ncbi:MAG TPA: 30S ribosomal protein S16 [Syntrophales bacterium]|nr:30S ribosomal protein S16 [Syntrophales bacterium]HOX94298.1 30S ribosomal protein S16 [Syntrophales bacterium]HPI58396.1 30S ribosomal protein S16 [Syntrophales bacterium]HPN26070.1 30S ribosomal protein S16 [Syntrophales bacterium]HQM30407.1 30S ribosomal protein S16 [Syntrophales bacterium]